jgi:hypothetical protein
MIPLTQIPDFTEADAETLKKMYGSEVFMIVLKLIKREYFIACQQMEECSPEALVTFQGTAKGLKQVYNLVMFHSSPDMIKEQKDSKPLLLGKKVANFKQ